MGFIQTAVGYTVWYPMPQPQFFLVTIDSRRTCAGTGNIHTPSTPTRPYSHSLKPRFWRIHLSHRFYWEQPSDPSFGFLLCSDTNMEETSIRSCPPHLWICSIYNSVLHSTSDVPSCQSGYSHSENPGLQLSHWMERRYPHRKQDFYNVSRNMGSE